MGDDRGLQGLHHMGMITQDIEGDLARYDFTLAGALHIHDLLLAKVV